jgi:hypothetical protein
MANRLNGYEVAVLAVDGFDADVLPGGEVNADKIRLLAAGPGVRQGRRCAIEGRRHARVADHQTSPRDGAATRWRNEGFAMSAIPLRPAYQDSLMHITFPDDQPVFDGANLTVRFTARVDGEPVECGNYRRGAGRSFRRPFRAGIRLNGCFRQRPQSYPFSLRGNDRPERRQRSSVT